MNAVQQQVRRGPGRPPKEPCKTHLVAEFIRTANDFVTPRQISEATGVPYKNVSSALWALQQYKAVEFVTDAKNGLHCFWTGEDTRTKHLEERVPEEGRRTRGKIYKKRETKLQREAREANEAAERIRKKR